MKKLFLNQFHAALNEFREVFAAEHVVGEEREVDELFNELVAGGKVLKQTFAAGLDVGDFLLEFRLLVLLLGGDFLVLLVLGELFEAFEVRFEGRKLLFET